MRIALAPTDKAVLQAIANDPRMFATLHPTDTFPYALIERVRISVPTMSEQALRRSIETLTKLGLTDRHPNYAGWRVTVRGSEVLSGTQ